MSNIASYFGEFPPNNNGLQEWGHGQNVVGGGYTKLMLGKVIGYPHMESHHITSTYNVALTDIPDGYGGQVVIHNCSQVLPNAGLDYNGVREPLMDGTPVLVLCKDGVFDQGYIIGCVRLSGDYNEFMFKGNVPKPFTTVEGWQGHRTANPGPSFPYVVARPEDYVRITPMDNLISGFSRPEYEQDIKDKAKKRAQPGSVEIRTMGGDVIHYTKNTFAIYADRQVVILALSGNESKCTALAKQASYYGERYEALKRAIDKAPDKTENGGMSNWNSNKPVGYTKELNQLDRTSLDWAEPMGVKYHLDELYKLTNQYRKASAACNSTSASLNKGADSIKKKVFDTASPLNRTKPKESGTGTPPQGSRAGIEVDEILDKLGGKAPDAMTIHKVGGGDYWDVKGDEPIPMASTVKLQVVDIAVHSKLPKSITITEDVIGVGEEDMLGISYTPEELIRKVLKDSNNTATKALIKAVAGNGADGPNPKINDLLKERGYTNTTLGNYLNTPNPSLQGNRSTTNDVSKAMENVIGYEGDMSGAILESLEQSETPFTGGRVVDGATVKYNKIGGTSTAAANSAVVEVDGAKYIITTGKGGVDGTGAEGDAISDAAMSAAIKHIRELNKMGGPSNDIPNVGVSNLKVEKI